MSDQELAGTAFIPAGDAWLELVLDKNGLDLAGLTASELVLAKAAQVAFVAHKVVSSAPVRGSKSGPVEIKPVSAQEKAQICQTLMEEWQQYLNLLGCSEHGPWWSGSFGGSKYD